MEKCSQNLSDYLQSPSPLIKKIYLKLLEISLNSKNLLHGNLKPSNIFIFVESSIDYFHVKVGDIESCGTVEDMISSKMNQKPLVTLSST